jgi:hypothetical protein
MPGRRLQLMALTVVLAAATVCLALACKAEDAKAPLYVGLRRSSYGLPKQSADHTWWSDRAKQYAAHFTGAQPMILEIVSTYQDGGATQLEFSRPADFNGPADKMTFAAGRTDHQAALAEYDRAGVKAILQLEPGEADVARCFEAAWMKFKAHPCVIGFAVDAEWYFTDKSKDKSGLTIPDAEAKKWMDLVRGFKPDFVLVLKHWDPKHLPPTYRHANLCLLSDSQDFRSQAEWMADLAEWSKAYKGSAVGFQFGYPKDRPWWSKTAQPPVDLGKALLATAPNCRCLLWVDFTAGQVDFK